MSAPRFEICRTDDGWTARFRSSNGKVIFSTGSQVYTRRKGALNAIHLIADPSLTDGRVYLNGTSLEVRECDERTGQ